MGRASVEASRPAMWQIEDAGKGAPSRYVRFGAHRIAIADIAGISLEEVRTRNVTGLVTGAAAFIFAASVLVYFVFEEGAMLRFLIGAAFLAALGIMGLHEALQIRKVSHFEMILTLKEGNRVVFTSTDRADIQALALRIAAEQAG